MRSAVRDRRVIDRKLRSVREEAPIGGTRQPGGPCAVRLHATRPEITEIFRIRNGSCIRCWKDSHVLHPFTAPEVMPDMICFCAQKYSSTTGSETMTTSVKTRFQSELCVLKKL